MQKQKNITKSEQGINLLIKALFALLFGSILGQHKIPLHIKAPRITLRVSFLKTLPFLWVHMFQQPMIIISIAIFFGRTCRISRVFFCQMFNLWILSNVLEKLPRLNSKSPIPRCINIQAHVEWLDKFFNQVRFECLNRHIFVQGIGGASCQPLVEGMVDG